MSFTASCQASGSVCETDDMSSICRKLSLDIGIHDSDSPYVHTVGVLNILLIQDQAVTGGLLWGHLGDRHNVWGIHLCLTGQVSTWLFVPFCQTSAFWIEKICFSGKI